jgi:pimeloyl-ACP methyl ester carboxylesterase
MMRNRLPRLVSGLLLMVLAFGARADVAVLVHGYLGNAASWEMSGVNAALRSAGWQDGGVLGGIPGQGAGSIPATDSHVYYRVELPSMAPAMVQARALHGALDQVIARHPQQRVTLVGHSAGGVVARLALVLQPRDEISRLISIAAPQSGTDRALAALDATDDSGMFGFIKEWFVRDRIGDPMYDTLQWSRGILIDLAPPQPGSLLWWLNTRQQPDIEYISVVRANAVPFGGDLLVPPFSQDLNQIPVLRGRSSVHLVASGHELNPADGQLLVKLL